MPLISSLIPNSTIAIWFYIISTYFLLYYFGKVISKKYNFFNEKPTMYLFIGFISYSSLSVLFIGPLLHQPFLKQETELLISLLDLFIFVYIGYNWKHIRANKTESLYSFEINYNRVLELLGVIISVIIAWLFFSNISFKDSDLFRNLTFYQKDLVISFNSANTPLIYSSNAFIYNTTPFIANRLEASSSQTFTYTSSFYSFIFIFSSVNFLLQKSTPSYKSSTISLISSLGMNILFTFLYFGSELILDISVIFAIFTFLFAINRNNKHFKSSTVFYQLLLLTSIFFSTSYMFIVIFGSVLFYGVNAFYRSENRFNLFNLILLIFLIFSLTLTAQSLYWILFEIPLLYFIYFLSNAKEDNSVYRIVSKLDVKSNDTSVIITLFIPIILISVAYIFFPNNFNSYSDYLYKLVYFSDNGTSSLILSSIAISLVSIYFINNIIFGYNSKNNLLFVLYFYLFLNPLSLLSFQAIFSINVISIAAFVPILIYPIIGIINYVNLKLINL